MSENPDLLVCQGAFCTIGVVSQIFFFIVVIVSIFFPLFSSFDLRLVISFSDWMSLCAREVLGLEGLQVLLDQVSWFGVFILWGSDHCLTIVTAGTWKLITAQNFYIGCCRKLFLLESEDDKLDADAFWCDASV